MSAPQDLYNLNTVGNSFNILGHKAISILNNINCDNNDITVPYSEYSALPSSESKSKDSSNNSNCSDSGDSTNAPIRQLGIVSKLLKSYGFIRCTDDNTRIFFHSSEFNGIFDNLQIGDTVEFEIGYHKNSGKPTAHAVVKITTEVTLSTTGYYTGVVIFNSGTTDLVIKCENGETCFFLNFHEDDVIGNIPLSVDDKVTFQMYTDPKGHYGATSIRLDNFAQSSK